MQGNSNQFYIISSNILNVQSTHRDAYKALKSGSTSDSVYKNKKKQSGEADKLQDCVASTDWNMLRDSSDGIEEYTTLITGFINKCVEDIVPTVTVRTYTNQKPWITGNIRTELKGRAATFKEFIRNPTIASDEPSNRQSVNTGPRSNRTTPALVICGRACKLLDYKRDAQPRAAQ